jgi:hypothetical protein
MFAYTGLTPAQTQILGDKYHVYMTRDGRISVAGLNKNNIDYVADSFHQVCSSTKDFKIEMADLKPTTAAERLAL